jgi:hypothetical protein
MLDRLVRKAFREVQALLVLKEVLDRLVHKDCKAMLDRLVLKAFRDCRAMLDRLVLKEYLDRQPIREQLDSQAPLALKDWFRL